TPAAPLVAELLAAAEGLVVLVTSRTTLRLSGEHEFAVAPLPTPPAGVADEPQLADLQGYASVQLFVERAHAASPGFELTSENAGAIAEICRRLDGLPLAIELAAARSRLLPPAALLARLDDRMSLLTAGARDLPERQRTLRNTLDWSFGLLSPAAQALFSRLGVFPGSFDLEAGEAVGGAGEPGPGGPSPGGEIIDTLASLVDASLVRETDQAGQPRFSLLGTIRYYSRDRLRASGQVQEAPDRPPAPFLEFAESATAGLAGPSQVTWLDRLEAEHDNLGAAMSWFLDQDQPGPAHQLGAATWRFWWPAGHWEEFARYGRAIVANGEQLPPGQVGYAQNGLGLMLIASGDPAGAQELFEQALALFRRLGDKLGIAISAGSLGHLTALRREYAEASKLLTESLALHQELGNKVSVALLYNFLGQIPLSQGDNDAAARLLRQGL